MSRLRRSRGVFGPRETTRLRRGTLGVVVVLALTHCTQGACGDATQVTFFSIAGEEISRGDQRIIKAIARRAVDDVRLHLPQLPTALVIRVQPGRDVIPETGETGTAAQPNMVLWTVDLRHAGGAQHVAKTWLRACLFHELHHLVRDAAVARASMLDIAVTEGMATAFERDFAHVVPPWGKYPPDAAAWVEELRGLPGDIDTRRTWMRRHPDGRRWIAYKTGTYLVDLAMRASGRSAAELVTTSTAEILRLGSSQ